MWVKRNWGQISPIPHQCFLRHSCAFLCKENCRISCMWCNFFLSCTPIDSSRTFSAHSDWNLLFLLLWYINNKLLLPWGLGRNIFILGQLYFMLHQSLAFKTFSSCSVKEIQDGESLTCPVVSMASCLTWEHAPSQPQKMPWFMKEPCPNPGFCAASNLHHSACSVLSHGNHKALFLQ